MATYDCDDFRVSFSRVEAGSYEVTASAADGRQIRTTFRMPMTTASLEETVLRLGRSRSREVAPDTVTAVRANAEQLGDELGQALFGETLGPFYEDARRTAANSGRGVRLTLSLASTPELLSVPWELLYKRRNFLASQRRTPVVRYLDVGDPQPPQRIDGPVRVLGVVASPAGLPVLDVADERARVEAALAGMIARGLVALDWCDPATTRSLRERLRDGSYHILHYVGHSDFTEAGDGLLFLVNETGGPAQVTESVLKTLLGDQTSLRLVVLNSCEGARTTLTDPYAGIATSLVALGVPAVVAMQFTISDRAAIVFAEELFTSLIGRQYPIDAAVAEARKAVFAEVNEIEWATPVLFLRSADGQLFDFATAPSALPLVVPPTPIVLDEPDAADTGGHPVAPVATSPETADEGGRPAIPPVAADSARPKRWIAVGAVLTALALAIAGFVVFGGGSDGGDDNATGERPVTTDAATSTTVDPLTAPFYSNTTTCAGDPVPPRTETVGLDEVETSALRTVQLYRDWLAEAQRGRDNSQNIAMMNALFPEGPVRNLDVLNGGFLGLAVNHLLIRSVAASESSADALDLRVLSLIYDDNGGGPTGDDCRTGFQCLIFTVDTSTMTISKLQFAQPGTDPPLTQGVYSTEIRWFGTGDLDPVDQRLPVADWLSNACDNATYRPANVGRL